MLYVKIEVTNFVLVNLYNLSNETEKVTTLHELGNMLKTIKDFKYTFGSRFCFFFNYLWIYMEAKEHRKRNL